VDNPYNADVPLGKDPIALECPVPAKPEMFFGYEAEIERVIRRLRNGLSCALFGGRRIGKTSFLWEVARRLLELEFKERQTPRVLPIYINLDRKAGAIKGRRDFFLCVVEMLAESIGKHLQVPLAGDELQRGIGRSWDVEKDFSITFKHIKSVLAAHDRESIQFVLLIDESDQVLGGRSDRMMPRDEKEALRKNLRSIIHDEPATSGSITMVMTGSVGFQQAVSETTSPLRGILDDIFLGSLSEADARALINQPTQGHLPEEVAEQILLQSGGHPHLIQYLIGELWDELCEEGPEGLEGATVEQVSEIAKSYRKRKETNFRTWWRDIGELGQKIYYELMRADSKLEEREILSRLSGEDGSKVKLSLQTLCFHGVVTESDDGYLVMGEMFKDWVPEPKLYPPQPKAQAVVLADICSYGRFTKSQQESARRLLEETARKIASRGLRPNFCEVQHGDQLCMTFDESVKAVRFAQELQRQLQLHNSRRKPDEIEVRVRIAIHYDDVLRGARGEPTGGAFDKAARMVEPDKWRPPRQDLAGRDCIILSERIYNHINHLADLQKNIERLGEFTLQNFTELHPLFELKPSRLVVHVNERWIEYKGRRVECAKASKAANRGFDILCLLLKRSQAKTEEEGGNSKIAWMYPEEIHDQLTDMNEYWGDITEDPERIVIRARSALYEHLKEQLGEHEEFDANCEGQLIRHDLAKSRKSQPRRYGTDPQNIEIIEKNWTDEAEETLERTYTTEEGQREAIETLKRCIEDGLYDNHTIDVLEDVLAQDVSERTRFAALVYLAQGYIKMGKWYEACDRLLELVETGPTKVHKELEEREGNLLERVGTECARYLSAQGEIKKAQQIQLLLQGSQAQ